MTVTKILRSDKIHIGWREWLTLPKLKIPGIKAKVDTGARTSAIHAFKIETFTLRGKLKVRFGVHPLQNDDKTEIYCVTDVLDRRMVSDSGGHREKRIVIATIIVLGNWQWPIEITLANRDTMKFRMLLGRGALDRRFIVDPNGSYLLSKELQKRYGKKKKKVLPKKSKRRQS